MRILIAEKETLFYDFIVSAKQQSGNRISIMARVSDADEAVQYITSVQPDLVLLDAQLPKKGGLYVLENIRPLHIPVIVLSQNPGLCIQAFRNGASDYLLKPFSRQEMEQSIEKVYQQLFPGTSLFHL